VFMVVRGDARPAVTSRKLRRKVHGGKNCT